jgi:hypothetical protein
MLWIGRAERSGLVSFSHGVHGGVGMPSARFPARARVIRPDRVHAAEDPLIEVQHHPLAERANPSHLPLTASLGAGSTLRGAARGSAAA